MADDVNAKVTDSVTQVTLSTVGLAPAQAMATFYQTSSAAAAIALQNAVHAQNNQYTISNAVMVEAVNLLLNSTTASSAATAKKLDEGFAGILARIAGLQQNAEEEKK